MQIDKVKITPKMAADWLETIPSYQRKIDLRQVRKLEIAITRGEWRENGATIVFNSSGELLDGQHRLSAIRDSGVAVRSLVVRNVSTGEETFNTIGDEKARKLTDFVHVNNANTVAAVIRFYWMVLNHKWPEELHSGGADVVPISDLLKVGRGHEEYISELVAPTMAAGRIVKQTSFCTFLVFYLTRIFPTKRPERLSEFFARLGDGVGLLADSPIYQLRQKFLTMRGTESIPRKVRMGLILKALNFHMEEMTCSKLLYNPDREAFPPLAGYDENKPTSFEKKVRQRKKLKSLNATVGV